MLPSLQFNKNGGIYLKSEFNVQFCPKKENVMLEQNGFIVNAIVIKAF